MKMYVSTLSFFFFAMNLFNPIYTQCTFDNHEFLRNALSLTLFDTNYSFKKLREPVNKTDWVSHGSPAVVNAYYASTENSMGTCRLHIKFMSVKLMDY